MAAITLATINETLENVDDNTKKTSTGITSFLSYLKGKDAKDAKISLEEKRESTSEKLKLGGLSKIKGDGAAFGFGSLSNLVPNFLKGLSLGAIASALPIIAKRLLRNVFKGGALIAFADWIVDNLLPDGLANSKFRNEIAGGLRGLGFSMLLGGKFKLLFTALGALLENEEFMKTLDGLQGDLTKIAKDSYGKLEPTLTELGKSLKGLFTTIFGGVTLDGVSEGIVGILEPLAKAANESLKALQSLIIGDFDISNILKAVGLLGAIGGLLMPGKFLKLMYKLAALAATLGGGALLRLAGTAGGALLSSALSFFTGRAVMNAAIDAVPDAKDLKKDNRTKTTSKKGALSRLFGLIKSGAKGAFGLMMSATGAAILVPLAAVGITEALFGDKLRDEDQENKAEQRSNTQTGKVNQTGTNFGVTKFGGSSSTDLIGSQNEKPATITQKGDVTPEENFSNPKEDKFSDVTGAFSKKITTNKLRDYFTKDNSSKIEAPIIMSIDKNNSAAAADFGMDTKNAGNSNVNVIAPTNNNTTIPISNTSVSSPGGVIDLQNQFGLPAGFHGPG